MKPTRFLADEDVDGGILRVLQKVIKRYGVNVHVVRVQDAGLMSSSDEWIVEWADRNRRVVLTHDRQTMFKLAQDRMAQGLPMSGMVILRRHQSRSATAHAIVEEVIHRAENDLTWDNHVVWI